MDSVCSAEMPRYQSHKKVWALKISNVSVKHSAPRDGYDSAPEEYTVTFEERGYAPKVISSRELHNRPIPQTGWYYVVYGGGYFSFSPAKEFDEGYTRL
jgi:hypothetical protein